MVRFRKTADQWIPIFGFSTLALGFLAACAVFAQTLVDSTLPSLLLIPLLALLALATIAGTGMFATILYQVWTDP